MMISIVTLEMCI